MLTTSSKDDEGLTADYGSLPSLEASVDKKDREVVSLQVIPLVIGQRFATSSIETDKDLLVKRELNTTNEHGVIYKV